MSLSLAFSCNSTAKKPSSTETDPAVESKLQRAGIDLSALTPRERKEWTQAMQSLQVPCPLQNNSVWACLDQPSCPTCPAAALFLKQQIRDGTPEELLSTLFRQRFDPNEVYTIEVDGSPIRGEPTAPITLFEFADFECPGCGMMKKQIDRVIDTYPHEIRLVFKQIPLSIHPHGESSARASLAAGAQGKFWEMYDLLFANQLHLTPGEIEGYAKTLGLDLPRFKRDQASQATTDRLQRDRALAAQLKIEATPTLFVNGRLFDRRKPIQEWIEIERMLVAPHISPTSPKGGQPVS